MCQDFYSALKSDCLDDPEGENALFIRIMLAAVEYEAFIRMMREVAEEERIARK